MTTWKLTVITAIIMIILPVQNLFGRERHRNHHRPRYEISNRSIVVNNHYRPYYITEHYTPPLVIIKWGCGYGMMVNEPIILEQPVNRMIILYNPPRHDNIIIVREHHNDKYR
jgi:hypothetical protein